MSVDEGGRPLIDFVSDGRPNGPDVVPYHADPASYSTAIVGGSHYYDNRTSEQRPLLGRSRSRMDSHSDSEYQGNHFDDPEFTGIIHAAEQAIDVGILKENTTHVCTCTCKMCTTQNSAKLITTVTKN